MSTRLYSKRRVLWMPFGFDWKKPAADMKTCCPEMAAALDFSCDQHAGPFECPDGLVIYHEIFDEYGLPVRDGGASYVLISHCPWCGMRLPESRRDRWFDAMDEKGIDIGDIDAIPPEFLGPVWRADGASGGT
jgi:hypothetical protein